MAKQPRKKGQRTPAEWRALRATREAAREAERHAWEQLFQQLPPESRQEHEEFQRIQRGIQDALQSFQRRPAEARALLGLGQGPLTSEQIAAAFRQAAMRAHPDRGGDGAEFQRLAAARDYLLARLTGG
jgi:hypothetical protein